MFETLRKWLWTWVVAAAFMSLQPNDGWAGETKIFDIHVIAGKVADGEEAIRVTEGDQIVLRWQVDRPAEIHLHGYAIETVASPGTVAETTVTAHATGRFPITSHGADGEHLTLTYLEVYPR